MNPLISICIPAYKNEFYFRILLDSIGEQTFKDYEVIITDDSPDNNLEKIYSLYKSKFCVKYYRNEPALGTPANWNFAIGKAKGQWIKIMHNDDWFISERSLHSFAEATKKNTDFIFSAYSNINLQNSLSSISRLSMFELALLKKSPYNLFKKNFIGHPSTTLIRRKHNQIVYDENIKWVVDFDYYIRFLSENNDFIYINIPLINIGIHDNQVTKASFRIREVEIPENIYLLNKLGIQHLKNIFVYDYYWRLCRNLNIREPAELSPLINVNLAPAPFIKMIRAQSQISKALLKIGIFSKILMSISYVNNYLRRSI